MAYTLKDYAQLADTDLKKGVIDVFRREAIVADQMSFENVDSLAVTVIRTKKLPTVAFRKIGNSFSESKGEFEPISENLFQMGGYIDVDKVLVKSKTTVDQRAKQTDMFLTSISYMFNDYFINGDPTVDVDGFTGLYYRIWKYHAAQEVNAGGLDISPDATGLTANQITLIDYMQKLFHKCDGHKADVAYCNDTLLLRLCSALRASGYLDTTQDNYGRWVETYGPNGPKLYDIGPKADQTTSIIGDVENTGGEPLTSGTATSCYAVKYGENFLQGMQLYSPDTVDIGLLETGVAYRTVVDWPVGLLITNPRSIARLSGVVAA